MGRQWDWELEAGWDFGVELGVIILTDTSAAKGIANRKGLGKVRHIDVSQVWVQDRIARGDLSIRKVNGKDNNADILNKRATAEDIRVHMHRAGQTIVQGRNEIPPEDN